MNREIKFRAWDGHHMTTWELMKSILGINHWIYGEESEIILMQYIGVKGYEGSYEDRHKNEVELYEGDIVEAMSEGSKGRFVIKFRNEAQPTFMLYPAWQSGKFWNIAASDLGRKKGDYYDDLKRIGNIYENPELLKP